MASRWRKAKLALGLCVYVPRDRDDGETALGVEANRFSDTSTVSPVTTLGNIFSSMDFISVSEITLLGPGG